MSHQPVGGYKEEEPGHHAHQPQTATASQQAPQHGHQRPGLPHHQQHQQHSSAQQHQQHQQQPQQPPPAPQQHPSSAYSSPHLPQHQSPFAPPTTLPGPGSSELAYYAHPTSYATPSASSASYPAQVAEGADVMATHTMSRPTYPPIYHTPQTNSPASVASPSAQDHRSVYSSQQPMAPMYGYGQPYTQLSVSAGPPPYQQQQPQHHSITSGPLLMSQTPGQTMTPPQTHHQHLPPSQGPPKLQQTPLHKASPPSSASKSTAGGGGSSVNPNAAPGPIPATTPLVVRQDQNGVQWIMFEYSRDRVKMEYTIRCDVESVNVDALTQDFKTENCVYPRACCTKEQYRGNRLVYETECNTVGWALAELNPPLRGKRGLIQRAVDSWRNSNQDPRLRSRRVRRMAKLNSRKNNAAQAAQTHLGAGSPGVQLPSSGVGLGLKAPGLVPNTQAPLQHHHHQPSGDDATNGEEPGILVHHHGAPQQFGAQLASGNNSRSTSGHLSPAVGGDEFGNGQAHHHHQNTGGAGEIRPRHIFHGYGSSYPSDNVGGASIPPTMHDGMDPMGSSSNAPTAVAASSTPPKPNTSLFGDIPDHKRRKFILVDDPHRGSRVRVRVMLDQVQMQEIPDSYRKSNSVYPRSFVSSQEDPDAHGIETHTSITVPMLDGSNITVSPPPPSSSKRKKELDLNELGYRMSWSQSRVFAGRTMFLQRALDAYRNKMRSSMMANGSDVVDTAPHLETRVGKRRFMERNRRSKAGSGSSSTSN